MKHKLLILPFVLSIIFVFMFPGFSFADSDSYITLDLDKTEVKVGDIITGTLKINNIANFNGFQVNIRYNPNILQAVDPDTGSPFSESTMPSKNTILTNSNYAIFPMVKNDPSQGIINFGKTYLYMDKYKEDNKPETTGILGVIGFKVLKDAATEIIFEDSAGTLPGSVNGTILFDWNGKQITTGYSVKKPPKINPAAKFELMPTLRPAPTLDPKATPKSVVSSVNSYFNTPANSSSSSVSDSSAGTAAAKSASSNLIIIITLSALAVVIVIAAIVIFTTRKKK